MTASMLEMVWDEKSVPVLALVEASVSDATSELALAMHWVQEWARSLEATSELQLVEVSELLELQT